MSSVETSGKRGAFLTIMAILLVVLAISDFTKVLVDGAPINPPGAAVDFSGLTFDNIDKVEIVRVVDGRRDLTGLF